MTTLQFKGQQANNDPVIDWELSVKLAGNKRDLANDMLHWLIKHLPAEVEEIKRAKECDDLHELSKLLHKLHGALCYCGVPRLRKAVSSFEIALKHNKIDALSTFLQDFEYEAACVLERVSQYISGTAS